MAQVICRLFDIILMMDLLPLEQTPIRIVRSCYMLLNERQFILLIEIIYNREMRGVSDERINSAYNQAIIERCLLAAKVFMLI